jgi:hypothetical protein
VDLSDDHVIAHSESQQKTWSAFLILPGSNLCFAVMTNDRWASPSSLINAVVNEWTDQ